MSLLPQPQSFIEQLCGSKRVVAEEEMKEKLLTALRVDVGSTEALKRLKGQDRATVSHCHHVLTPPHLPSASRLPSLPPS